MSGDWKFGLFSCFDDMDACLLGYFCPCVLFGKTRELLTGEGCCGACCLCSLLPCCCLIKNRGDIRAKYGIQGSCCGDFCTHYCCGCCALIQENREVKANGGGAVTPQMQAQ